MFVKFQKSTLTLEVPHIESIASITVPIGIAQVSEIRPTIKGASTLIELREKEILVQFATGGNALRMERQVMEELLSKAGRELSLSERELLKDASPAPEILEARTEFVANRMVVVAAHAWHQMGAEQSHVMTLITYDYDEERLESVSLVMPAKDPEFLAMAKELRGSISWAKKPASVRVSG